MSNNKPSIALPVIAFACLFLCWPLGFILSIVAIVKYGSATGTEARTLSIVAVMANGLALPIVGILAAIAIPNFILFQCRSKQSEAKGNLKALHLAEQAYRSEKNVFTTDLAALEFTPKGATIRYNYSVERANEAGFLARATAKPDVAPELKDDTWEIDQTGQLNNVVNGCRR